MAAPRRSLHVLILAAGQGKRLRSKTIKLLHAVAGRPMVAHVVETVRALRPVEILAVVGPRCGPRARCARRDGMHVRPAARAARHGTRGAPSRAAAAAHARRRAVDRERRPPGPARDDARAPGRAPRALARRADAVDGRARRSERVRPDRPRRRRADRPDRRGSRRLGHRAAHRARSTAGSTAPTRCGSWPCCAACGRDNAQGEYYLTDAVRELLRAGATVEAVLPRRRDRGRAGREHARGAGARQRACCTRARPQELRTRA